MSFMSSCSSAMPGLLSQGCGSPGRAGRRDAGLWLAAGTQAPGRGKMASVPPRLIEEPAVPEDQAILTRVVVVLAPDGLDAKSESLVERAGRGIRLAHLEGGRRRSAGDGVAEDMPQQSARQTAPPLRFVHRHAVEVQFVE